ncbi:MAG TPA: SNF2-related protein [Myxococcota bacterium]|nr:SNF2-related protein [Myxococcota bacterium]
MGGSPRETGTKEQLVLPGMEPLPGEQPPKPEESPARVEGRDFWLDRVRAALAARSTSSRAIAEDALRHFPGDGEILLLVALATLMAKMPDRALVYLKRYRKRYEGTNAVSLLTALALAHQGHFHRAARILEDHGLQTLPEVLDWFVGDGATLDWLHDWWVRIRRESVLQRAPAVRTKASDRNLPTSRGMRVSQPPPQELSSTLDAAPTPDLVRLDATFDVRFEPIDMEAIQIDGESAEPHWFRLRGELIQLSLLQGFDELLCLPALRGVETHWYQVETVRKVLKQFRGRVLLADEVGLGKTIEAGMVLKEYMLRGMAERLLILTPAGLVGQWRDEMASKFSIDCATSHDALLRSDPASFWAQPRVIASIAAARRKEHAELLARLSFDLVVVDEAHHLKEQSSASYRLVNSLQKRFLLLLSATPVQNNLLELYNLLTLLQPGIFKTQKEFKAAYVTPGKPREPLNREMLRDLMRSVMVRNTRALAALRLPRRCASTLRVIPTEAEASCYRELTGLAREVAATRQHTLAVQHLLGAGGSSAAAAAAAIGRFAARHPEDERWTVLHARYSTVSTGAKEAALLKLLAQNPTEKKMVFVHYRESMVHLAALLRGLGIVFVTFEGGMSGLEKDAAIDAFRDAVPVLLCSESGGEGRNLQFCNTLINFDIPWNPMSIEQRIGRIDRIGQTREVFVFNLATSGTIEDQILRILHEKINMFELVVGEAGAILGEFAEQHDFSTLILDAWLKSTDEARQSAIATLESQLVEAQRQYQDAKQLDATLFGDDLEAM